MEEHLKSVTRELLDKQVFNCSSCKEFMGATKIILIENVGDVCLNCFEEHFSSFNNCIQNTSLELLVNSLILPCQYSDKGCEYWAIQKDLSVHEETCTFRSKLCPMAVTSTCDWQGFPYQFHEHFQTCHGDYIVNFDNNMFMIEISVDERDITRLLTVRSLVFLLRMKIDFDQNKLIYTICNTKDDVDNFEYSVKHKGPMSDNYIKTKSRILSSHFLYSLDESVAVSVDLESLKQTVKVTDRITNIFKIKTGGLLTNVFEETMLYYFECPICKTFMKPPIYQCTSGHSICSSCKPRLDKCPTCRAIFGPTRNYSLEGLTSRVQYPCAYYDKGCLESGTNADMTKHEAMCPFKPYNCPFSNCTMIGTHEDVVSHLKQFHGDQLVLSDSQGYTESFRSGTGSLLFMNQFLDRKILLAYGQIFRLTCKRIVDCCLWAAELVGTRNETVQQNYTYEVSIIDMKRPEKRLIRTDYVLTEMSDEDILKRCIMFPNSILSGYTHNGMVSFHFKVKQAKNHLNTK